MESDGSNTKNKSKADTRIIQNVHGSLGHVPTFFWCGRSAGADVHELVQNKPATRTVVIEKRRAVDGLSESDPSPRLPRAKDITILYR